MQVKALDTPEEFARYVAFGQAVYGDNSPWVPPDAPHLIQLLSGEGGFGSHTQIQPFWVEAGDRILATVTAVTSEAYDERWNERLGHLVFFEALPDQNEAVATLMRSTDQWFSARNCQGVRMSFLPGMQLGVTIDSYDEVPTVFHAFNPDYYHSYIKNAGFVTERGVVQYQVEFTPELAQRYRDMVKRASESGIVVRSWNFDDLETETATFAALGNETFSAHWGFMPLPEEVMRGFTVESRDFLIPEFMGFAEAEGRPVGFVYSVPDLNQALHPMRDKALEEHFSEFQDRFQQIDHGALLIIGVKNEFRGRGINLALAAHSYLGMIDHGYKRASYTVVLDDNWPSRRTAEKLGARVTRSFIVYRRELGHRL